MRKMLQKMLDMGSKEVSVARLHKKKTKKKQKSSSVEHKPFCVNGPLRSYVTVIFGKAFFDNEFSVFVGFNCIASFPL